MGIARAVPQPFAQRRKARQVGGHRAMQTGWMFAYASNMHLPDIECWLRDNTHPTERVAQVGEVLMRLGRSAGCPRS